MKNVTIVFPEGGANFSSIMGSVEILTAADEYWQQMGNPPMMKIQIAGCLSELSSTTGFFSIHPISIEDIRKTDLIIIPSLLHNVDYIVQNNEQLRDWIRQQYKSGAEIASICTGAFLLASTGLLDGKTCSTHWNAADNFRRLFPNIELCIDQLINVQQGIYTNGGAFSFLNLILFLVEKYFDRPTAVYCSKMFQIDMDRTLQSPFFIFQPQKNHGDDVIVRAQTYMEQNIKEKISFEDLASLLAVSRRNFDRRFVKATGNTPAEYFQRVKVEFAKEILERGRKTIYEVMNDVGYSDERAFRDVFRKVTGLSPNDYRMKFNRVAVMN